MIKTLRDILKGDLSARLFNFTLQPWVRVKLLLASVHWYSNFNQNYTIMSRFPSMKMSFGFRLLVLVLERVSLKLKGFLHVPSVRITKMSDDHQGCQGAFVQWAAAGWHCHLLRLLKFLSRPARRRRYPGKYSTGVKHVTPTRDKHVTTTRDKSHYNAWHVIKSTTTRDKYLTISRVKMYYNTWLTCDHNMW